MSRSWLVIVIILAAVVCPAAPTRAQERQVAVPDCRWETDIGIPGAFSPFFTSLHEEEINAVLQVDLNGIADTEVYVAGIFWYIGEDDPTTAFHNGVARWDGAQWHKLMEGLDRDDGFGEELARVRDMVYWDDGSGPAIYFGGNFDRAYHGPQNGNVSGNSIFAGNIVRWDGTAWSAVGVGGGLGAFGRVFDLQLFDDGTGEQLYALGDIRTNVGAPVDTIGRWDGSSWSRVVGNFMRSSGALGLPMTALVFDDGSGSALYVGGQFDEAPGGVAARNIARWDGTSWSALGGGIGSGLSWPIDEVVSMVAYDDRLGGGPALYVGGAFEVVDGKPISNIARWDGSEWSSVGIGLEAIDAGDTRGGTKVLTVFNQELWAGGQFAPPAPEPAKICRDDEPAQHLASWDGIRWRMRLTGVFGLPQTQADLPGVHSLTEFEHGSTSEKLFVGGFYHAVGCVDAEEAQSGPNSIAIIDCSCPGPIGGGASCGNGVCESSDGEDCLNCALDCDGVQQGNPSSKFCCGSADSGAENPVNCSDPRCTDNGFECIDYPAVVTCCGDSACQVDESVANCAEDCLFGTPGGTSRQGYPGELMKITGYDDVGGTVDITYLPACHATQHTVYYGDLASVAGYGYSGATCDVGISGSASFDPGPTSVFFLIVGHDGTREGSYGFDTPGLERPEDTGTLGGCDHPQELGGVLCQ